MANPITSTRIIEGVKRRITIPATQALIENSDILDFANDVIKEDIVPLIISLRENFFVTISDITTVDDQEEYNIPKRAAGRTIRDLKLKYGDGDTQFRDLPQIDIEDIYGFGAADASPSGYYFKGDKIALLGQIQNNQNPTLRVFHERYPSDLVENQYASTVVSVAGTVVTVDTVPSNIAVNELVDFIAKDPAHEIKQESSTVTATTATTLTFGASTDIPSDLEAGDYISLEETTPVLQLPKEAWPLTEILTAQRVLEGIGDFEGAQLLESRLKKSEDNLRSLLAPRNRGEFKKIVNRKGLLRGYRWLSRYGGGRGVL